MSTDPTITGRPYGPSFDLPLHAVRVQLGAKLRPDALMHGHYEREYNWYAKWTLENGPQRGARLNAGHKREMRAVLALLDNSYEAEVVGVRLISEQCSLYKANQCYLGDPQAGNWGGSSAVYRVVFRGAESDGRQDRGQMYNHVAYEPDVWFPGHVVERAAKLNNARFKPLINLRAYTPQDSIGLWTIRGETVVVPGEDMDKSFTRRDVEEKSVFSNLKRKLRLSE